MNNKKAKMLAHEFYLQVYSYIDMEYKPKYTKLLTDSDISEKLVDLITKYFRANNTVPFTAGQIVDLLQSKYGKK